MKLSTKANCVLTNIVFNAEHHIGIMENGFASEEQLMALFIQETVDEINHLKANDEVIFSFDSSEDEWISFKLLAKLENGGLVATPTERWEPGREGKEQLRSFSTVMWQIVNNSDREIVKEYKAKGGK